MESIDALRKIYLEFLNDNVFDANPTELYGPVDYIMQLGGKRIRPVLVLLGCQIFSEDFRRALPAAHAIETFHNFSLVHDDIMDDAPLRRGQDTVHIKYDLNTAILSGDVMLIKAIEFLLQIKSEKQTEIIGIFTKMAREVCEGQQYDMNFENEETVTLERYVKMIEFKTSVLIGAAIQMGALIGGANKDDAQKLYDYGRNTGIAFQVQDDILDAYGDPDKVGKQVGGDILQGKKTFLTIQALGKASSADRTLLLNQLNNQDLPDADRISTVISLYEKYDIKSDCEKIKSDYLQAGIEQVDAIHASAEAKTILKAFATELVERAF